MESITQRLINVRQRIADSAAKYHRSAQPVRLIAVSKTRTVDEIRSATRSGQRDFGENYLQDALEKIKILADEGICWHFIGPIQSNKTSQIAQHFDWVHSVDRAKIAQRLSTQRPKHLPPLNVCLQINIGTEASKSGIAIDEAEALALEVLQLSNLRLRGLMAIPAPVDSFELQRSFFCQLRNLYERLQEAGIDIDTLSMGMSNDLEAAIAEGATMVRIGTAIFGSRN